MTAKKMRPRPAARGSAFSTNGVPKSFRKKSGHLEYLCPTTNQFSAFRNQNVNYAYPEGAVLGNDPEHLSYLPAIIVLLVPKYRLLCCLF